MQTEERRPGRYQGRGRHPPSRRRRRRRGHRLAADPRLVRRPRRPHRRPGAPGPAAVLGRAVAVPTSRCRRRAARDRPATRSARRAAPLTPSAVTCTSSTVTSLPPLPPTPRPPAGPRTSPSATTWWAAHAQASRRCRRAHDHPTDGANVGIVVDDLAAADAHAQRRPRGMGGVPVGSSGRTRIPTKMLQLEQGVA